MATRTKEKAAARRANADKRPQAHARYVRISPRKVKIVIDLIRGKNVDEALAILQFTPKAASPVVMKVLFLSPAWPRKVRVGANSPSLWPTMSSVT